MRDGVPIAEWTGELRLYARLSGEAMKPQRKRVLIGRHSIQL